MSNARNLSRLIKTSGDLLIPAGNKLITDAVDPATSGGFITMGGDGPMHKGRVLQRGRFASGSVYTCSGTPSSASDAFNVYPSNSTSRLMLWATTYVGANYDASDDTGVVSWIVGYDGTAYQQLGQSKAALTANGTGSLSRWTITNIGDAGQGALYTNRWHIRLHGNSIYGEDATFHSTEFCWVEYEP